MGRQWRLLPCIGLWCCGEIAPGSFYTSLCFFRDLWNRRLLQDETPRKDNMILYAAFLDVDFFCLPGQLF